jgi:hypothetical protein
METGNTDLILDIRSLENSNYELGTEAYSHFDALANAYTTYCKEYLRIPVSRIAQWVIKNNPGYLKRIVKEVEPEQSPTVKKVLQETKEYRERLEVAANKPKQANLF